MRKSRLIRKIDNPIFFKIFVALLWTRGILLDYARGVILNLPLLSAAADYFIPAVMCLMFLLSYRTITERIRGTDLVFIVACIVVYVGEYLLFRRNRSYFSQLYPEFLFGCLPFYFVGVSLRQDDGTLVPWLYRISSVSILAFAVYMTLFNSMEGVTLRGGDMNSAYNLLPHACLSFYFLMSGFNWRRLLLFLVAAVSMLMMGTRGAVLCLFVFIVVVTVLTIRFQRPIVLLSMVLICLLFLFFEGLVDTLIEAAYSVGETFGLSTRIFDKMLSGDFAVSAARDHLKQRILHYLKGYPLVGLGIYGDCFVSGGKYAHNLFLEIYAHFGYVIGTILLGLLTVLLCRGLGYSLKSGDNNARLISLLLLCCCFKLVVSSSYLREPFFWVMLGYFVSLIREKKTLDRAEQAGVQKSRFIK